MKLYTFEKMKIYCRIYFSRYNDLLQHYNTPLSQFVCDLILCWCVLHTPDLTPPDMTGYTLDSVAGAWPQKVKFTLPEHLFILGFSWVCCLECALSWLWTNGFRLTDDGRLFPSLYLHIPCVYGSYRQYIQPMFCPLSIWCW